MRIGVPSEIHSGERRVAISPVVAESLIKMGFTFAVQAGAGVFAHFTDEVYRARGVEIVSDVKALWAQSDILLKVRSPEFNKELAVHESDLLKPGSWLISFIWPAQNPELLKMLSAKGVTVLGMDAVPRISRAQKIDALSSMANIAGYRAVIEAAQHFGRFFTGQVTAAGKIPPAKIFVIGAGVAGLSAIGTSVSLGAIVRATDTRSEVKDQVKSMGGQFVEADYKEEGAGGGGYAKVMSEAFLKAQGELIARQCKEVDIIITTALIPGRPAPKLITKEMVQSMKQGSVIVDLAAEQGGNCELTSPGEVVEKFGVTMIGYTDFPSRLPEQSSTLYANNLLKLLEELCPKKDGVLELRMQDEMIRGTTIIEKGQIVWPPPKKENVEAPSPAMPSAKAADSVVQTKTTDAKHGVKSSEKKGEWPVALILAALAFLGIGIFAPPAFITHFTVFVLACFIGYMVVWNVAASLHTPLMSVTNAISSIIIIGALVQSSGSNTLGTVLVFTALLLTTINMAGGFWVTHRMLNMFKK